VANESVTGMKMVSEMADGASRGAGQVKSASDELAKMAEDLKNLVGQFKV
jgi:methyl-accepting chemotaxis protein